MEKRFTVAEVAAALDVTREEARGLITFLLAKGFAARKGERKQDGRGAPELVFGFADDFVKVLTPLLRRAFDQ